MKNKKDELVFSDEIIRFSKLIDESFNKVSLDVKNIKKEIIDKEVSRKKEIDKFKLEIIKLNDIINEMKININKLTIKNKNKIKNNGDIEIMKTSINQLNNKINSFENKK